MSRIVDTIRHEAPGPDEGAGRRTGPQRTGDPDLGVVQYFHKGDHETVESVLNGLDDLRVTNLRTAISWCDWTLEGGEEWYGWLLPKLTERFDVLPCFLYTPPALGILPKTSSPPRDPQAYGEFVEMVLQRHAGDFPYVELWNEPNNYIEWDWTIDPEWTIFAEMIAGAAGRAAGLGVKSVLGGMSPFDPNWLDLMFKRGALEHVDVIGVHGFPGTWEAVWDGWDSHIGRVEEVVEAHDGGQRIWVTEAGFSTWAHDEFSQLTTLTGLAEAPAERVYWYSVEDLAPERETLDGFHCDERAYHFGLQRRGGVPKLVRRVLGERGLDGVREMVAFAAGHGGPTPQRPGALVTGGAGFIGAELTDRIASSGTPVTILDSLAQPGSEESARRLKQKHGDLVRLLVGDVRDVFAVRRALAHADRVFHLAAQVSPAQSVREPRTDLDINVQGTMNVLEEARLLPSPPAIVFASTSDVHELSSPHACSKAAAEHYVVDYACTFGLRTCALRIDTVEDRAEAGDLVDALLRASTDERALTGQALDVADLAAGTSVT